MKGAINIPWEDKPAGRGDVIWRYSQNPNVAFPCAALEDEETGRLAIYYGGTDTVVCLAFGYVGEIVEFVKSNSIL